MSIIKVIREQIPNSEITKLNVPAFFLKEPEKSSMITTYDRKSSSSSFHNSLDLPRGTFYKQTSLLIQTNNESYQ